MVDILTRRLGIAVEIDPTGGLRCGAELRYTLGHDKQIEPTALRVDPGMDFDRVLAIDPGGRCERYNGALRDLRLLQQRLGRLVKRLSNRGSSLEQGSVLWGAHHYLTTLDATIASRQAQRMAHGAVSLETLRDETLFWERYHEHFTQIVARAEQAHRDAAPSRQT